MVFNIAVKLLYTLANQSKLLKMKRLLKLRGDRTLLFFFIFLSTKLFAQLPSTNINSTKSLLQFNCFIEQSFEPVDSVVIKVFAADSLLKEQMSDSGGKVMLYLDPGNYDISIDRHGYYPKKFKQLKVTNGAAFVRASMQRDFSKK